MRIIDLLNMASKGERLPEKIKLVGCPCKETWTLRDGMYESFVRMPDNGGNCVEFDWCLLTDYLDALFDQEELSIEVIEVKEEENNGIRR